MDYNQLDNSFSYELPFMSNENNQFYQEDVGFSSKDEDKFVTNYLIPIFASIGATTILVGCSCITACYWHANGIEINNLPIHYFNRGKI